MNEERRDNDVVDDRPYSRRWLMRGAAAFAVTGGIGSLGMVRWASATGGDDDYEDRESLDDDKHDDHDDRDDHDDHNDDDHSGPGGGDDRDDDDRDDDDDDDDEAAPAGTAAPGENRVEIRDEDAFSPSSITINAGEWVTWINFDDDEHTATGQDFDTGELETGARAEVQFNTPGSYTYVCQFHPEMVGEVIVLGGDATPQASPAATPQATPAAGGGGQEAVSIIDFAFEPQTLTVPVGTTVVWTNDGEAPHTVTGEPLDSGTLSSGDSFQFTFTTAGTIEYVCEFHPQMTGTIEVAG